MIKAVIFDLDDTLISENEYVKSGLEVVSRYLEKKYMKNTQTIYKELLNCYEENKKNIFNRWLEKNQIKYTSEEIEEIIKIYRCHKPKIQFYCDVIPTINKLKEKNIKIGIITDGYIETQKSKLNALNANKIFDEIILTDELGKEYWKPNPKGFEIIMKKLNVKFEEMMYVGDNPEKDFFIGNIYPITCIRIYRNNGIYRYKNYKSNIKEKYKIKNLEEIINII